MYMGKYQYWKCSENNPEGFGVKNIAINRFYAGQEVIDLINELDTQLDEYKEHYQNEKEKTEHYREVIRDLINGY